MVLTSPDEFLYTYMQSRYICGACTPSLASGSWIIILIGRRTKNTYFIRSDDRRIIMVLPRDTRKRERERESATFVQALQSHSTE